MTPAEKINYLLERSGKSWYRLAYDLGIPESTVYAWKKGDRKPTKSKHIRMIARYFGITLDQFYEGVDL